MKLLIPGGAGYIGSHMVKYAQEHGHEVVVIDVTTRLPIQPVMLETELRELCRVPEGTLKVFGTDEPLEKQTQKSMEETDEEYQWTQQKFRRGHRRRKRQ